jgi:hypothetical protein
MDERDSLLHRDAKVGGAVGGANNESEGVGHVLGKITGEVDRDARTYKWVHLDVNEVVSGPQRGVRVERVVQW